MANTTYYRTGKGSHRHADVHCANVLRQIHTGDPVKLSADEAPSWAPCSNCCDAAEIAKETAPAKPVKCANTGVTDTKRLYSKCRDCGKEGAVNRSTGTLRAHAPKKS